MIDIKHSVSGELIRVNQFWLRDHCKCSDCYNDATKQRSYNLLDIPADIKAVDLKYSKNGQMLCITWEGGHASEYDVNFIHENQVENVRKKAQMSTRKVPWNFSIVQQIHTKNRFKLSQLVVSDDVVKEYVSALVRYGVAFIDEVPPNTTMTEMAIRRVFPVMKTFFGEMFTFSDAFDHADTAYSKQYLGSHTDNTYFCDAAGLQALHCLEHTNGSGGENFLVDGLHCALELKRRNPKAFKVLSSVPVPAEYIESGQHHVHSAPMITVNPVTTEITQLRLNVYDRAVFNSVPQHEMADFYDSFREFLRIVQSSDNQWSFKLHPGTVMVFDNWRVYHGRNSYTGKRTMTGCYIQRTDFLSKARTLNLLDD